MEEEPKFTPRKLSKEQVQKIAEMASSIYMQGQSWVLSYMDLSTGVTRLIRGLSNNSAKRRLALWRKEKVEELLREEEDAKAYLIRKWEEHRGWNGEGIWNWVKPAWYTTKEEADSVCEEYKKEELICEVSEMKTSEIPGSFHIL